MPRTDMASRIHGILDIHPHHYPALEPLWIIASGVAAGAERLVYYTPGMMSPISSFLTIAAAVVTVTSLLQICCVLILHVQVGATARHADAPSNETLKLLEARHPGVAARASAIDPVSLIDRVLPAKKSRQPTLTETGMATLPVVDPGRATNPLKLTSPPPARLRELVDVLVQDELVAWRMLDIKPGRANPSAKSR